MKKFIEISLIILTLGILVACNPLPSAILQDNTCSAPCWNGIIPGQTSLQEVNTKLKTTSSVDLQTQKTIFIRKKDDGLSFMFLPNVREESGWIYFQDGIVQALAFWPKTNKLLLSDGLKTWGLPDRYISIYYSTAEQPYLVTSVIYSKQGIIVEFIKTMSSEGIVKLENDTPIFGFWYTNPSLTISMLENGTIDQIIDQDLLEGLKPWTGLGEIHYLKRDLWGIK
jgi:hypothetical protein